MILPVQEPIVSISEDEILKAAHQFGFNFPAAYRTFLSENNGAWIDERFARVDVAEFGVLHMQRFYSARSNSAAPSELVRINRDFLGRIPEECITIGFDQMGNQILLVCRGPDSGMVLFWDHEREGFEDNPQEFMNLYVLAPNLDTFCSFFVKNK